MAAAANRILCALDTPDLEAAVEMARGVRDEVAGLKLGLEFFTRHGPSGYRTIAAGGASIFLDLKLHDIPNTVAGAVRSLMRLHPFMLSVHASGGVQMMRAAKEAAEESADAAGVSLPHIVAITVLTSLDRDDLAATGLKDEPREQTLRLAGLARESRLDGVVCSPHEIEAVRKACGEDFLLVVPGIRPSGSPPGDQKRFLTPQEAVAAGADYLVIGRPITKAANPGHAAREINRTLTD